jgi:adenylate kinase
MKNIEKKSHFTLHTSHFKKRLVLLGGPGAGKGTQAVKLKEHYGIPHVSTGEVLREARSVGTELGKKAAEYMDAGKLLPDDIILGIVSDKLNTSELKNGFLFDGFPRTIKQAEGLDSLLGEKGQVLDAVLSIEVPDEIVIERLLKRAEIEGREDDNRETIENRLKVYYEQTEPLKAYYEKRSLLKSIDGVGTIDEIFERITSVLSYV